MTYLELVNDVLARLREQQVTTVNLTTYSSLIGKFVNDAKRQVEDAYDWNALGQDINVTTSSESLRVLADRRWSEIPRHQRPDQHDKQHGAGSHQQRGHAPQAEPAAVRLLDPDGVLFLMASTITATPKSSCGAGLTAYLP
jgi:hypothetical protein